MSALRQTTLEAGGARSPLIEAGPKDSAEAVLFIHGNPGSHSDWSELVGACGELGRVLAFDMPGFGKARAPAGFEFNVGSYAAFIEQARTQLGIERAHLVLHDFGGPFGLLWGLQHPQQWASTVLINIGVMPGYEWHTMAKRWRTPVVGELMHAYIPRWGWRRSMQSSSPRGLPPEFVDKMYDDYDRETRRTVLKLYRSTPDPGEVAEQLGREIAKLKVPALVVWGAADPFISVDYAERQRDYFAVGEVVTLPDSGHWPFQDDPARVRELVVGFLRAQLGASGTGPPRADAAAQQPQAHPPA